MKVSIYRALLYSFDVMRISPRLQSTMTNVSWFNANHQVDLSLNSSQASSDTQPLISIPASRLKERAYFGILCLTYPLDVPLMADLCWPQESHSNRFQTRLSVGGAPRRTLMDKINRLKR